MPIPAKLKTVIPHRYIPVLLLLVVQLLIGLFTFDDYGLSWDERLFYQYGEAIGYAYSIPAHLSPDFDLRNAYGPSADDHKIYGPAYLLLARTEVGLFRLVSNADPVALWHLANFLFYLLGTFFLYLLSLRWLDGWGAFGAAALFSTQPIFWGHAFINPKDMPFSVILITTFYYGFKLIDRLETVANQKKPLSKRDVFLLLWVGTLLGLATNLRLIGPLAGILLAGYALSKRSLQVTLRLIPVALSALLTLYVTWPYLWNAPLHNFLAVLARSANNPTKLRLLFNGQLYHANALPLSYLPKLLALTLTEPVWPLFIAGLGVAAYRLRKKGLAWADYGLYLFLFIFSVGYVLILHPPMYDGYRHFLFMLPPVFVTGGFAIDEAAKRLKAPLVNAAVIALILIPSVVPLIKLHPYQYTYYNNLIRGTWGANQMYETDYWLTCYKDAVEAFNDYTKEETVLYVQREYLNAAYYAADHIRVQPMGELHPGDYVLVSSRLNAIHTTARKSPVVIEIKRDGTPFCAIKQVTE